MKSIKVLALIVGAIALLPSASFAGNVAGSTQDANLNSAIIGDHNTSVTDVTQNIHNKQKAFGKKGSNVSGNAQSVTGNSITAGTGNTSVQQVLQQIGNIQKK